MTWLPTFATLDDAQIWLLRTLLNHGTDVRPRGSLTRELLAVSFTVVQPRNRCIMNARRRFSLPLAIGEFCWHVSASTDLNFIAYYAPRWREFADEEGTITGSCYGSRIFGPSETGSQWSRIVDLLREDPSSRRAVVSVWDPTRPIGNDVKDVPCTCTIQFLVRDGAVHAIAHMRSNDVIWGLPYDVFLFTMLQELLASQLGRQLGTYTHIASSLHLYERHFELAEEILAAPPPLRFEMPRMQAAEQLSVFLAAERDIRQEGEWVRTEVLDNYWRDLLSVLNWYSCSDRSKASPSLTGSRYDAVLNARGATSAASTYASIR